MNRPVRVQLRRTKGWRMPENAVKVSRPTVFGNPWTVAGAVDAGYPPTGAAQMCVDHFRDWATARRGSLTDMLKNGDFLRAQMLQALPSLRGKNLACWCPLDQPCHADVLLELANAEPKE